MSDVILSQVEQLNVYLKEHYAEAKDKEEEFSNLILKRQVLIESLFAPENSSWVNENKSRLELLQQELLEIEKLYSDEREQIKSEIQKQKHVNKGIAAYKSNL